MINLDAVADFLANSYDESEDPEGDLVYTSDIQKKDAKKLLAAWAKIGAKERFDMGMKEKELHSWIKSQLGKSESMGRIKALKEATLNKSDLEDVETEVKSSYTDKELKDFKDFEDFFAAVERQNAMDSEIPWKPKKWKPYFEAIYNKLIKDL